MRVSPVSFEAEKITSNVPFFLLPEETGPVLVFGVGAS